jgi:hypothetical protein
VTSPPVVVGDTVFAGHAEENISGTKMGALAAINGALTGNITKTGELWKIEELMLGKTAPAYFDGRLYCFDDSAKGFVLNAKTGEMIGNRQTFGTIMRACPLFADGKIYVGEQNGRWSILKPDDNAGMRPIARGKLEQGDEIHASPIVSHGKLYFMTTGCLYCLVDKSKTPGSTPLPETAKERPAADSKPAHVQVIPAEVLLKPGDKQPFKVRVFNSQGQLLSGSAAKFSVQGAGTITADGGFAAPADAKHVPAFVSATVGDVTGRARIRIVPPLPWSFDFEGLKDAPVTWVGARYRHVLRSVDGNNVMVKITTIPLGMKSRCWFGQPGLHDYTIQADVRGSRAADKMPDIGLIAQGYTMDLKGEQTLQIRAWDAQLRVEKSIAFTWQPDSWYTMKFQVAVQGDKSVLRGKVWPRGQPEPSQWIIETADEMPNKTGSPGLYGNATNAEIFLDNIQVFDNGRTGAAAPGPGRG